MKPGIDRIQINYKLRFSMPFHFGTGMRVGLIDRAVLRDSNQYLYVPGSTIKGVARESCEQLARFLGAEDKKQQRIESPHLAEAALEGFSEKYSIITRIFGSQIHPGQLFFEDARQIDQSFWDGRNVASDPEEKGKYKSLQVGVTTQVRLDRVTRTSVRTSLYTSEFGIRDLEFQGSIRGAIECFPLDPTQEDGPSYSLLLLLAGLLVVEHIGANKSTGKGQCSFEITQLQVNGKSYENDQWQSWLDQLESLGYYAYKTEE